MKRWYQIVCTCEPGCGGMYREGPNYSWVWDKKYRTIYPTKAAAQAAMEALGRKCERVEVAK